MFVLFRNRFKTRSYTLIMVSLLCMPAAEGFAQHEHAHGDILFTIDDVTGELATGSIANQSNVLTLEGQSIYEVELDDPGVFGLGQPFSGSEPGISGVDPSVDISPNLPLPGNAALTFELHSMETGGVSANLLFWDFSSADPTTVDEDDVIFQTVGTGHMVTLSDIGNPAISATVDGSDTDVTGFTIGTTSALGGLHQDVMITAAGAGGGEPDPGIYLWAMEFEIDSVHSDLVYMLGMTVGVDFSGLPFFDYSNIDYTDSEELEEGFESMMGAAEHWVEENMAGGHEHGVAVPEPSTIAMTLMGFFAALACLRRRHRNLR
jgi:hypothetical protein